MEARRDLREGCVFTIDGIGARDLDDALSAKRNDDGAYGIGAHIADASHFIKLNAPLDRGACKRVASTYLMRRTAPMLPPNLRTEVCSLDPCKGRLTFSAVFTMAGGAHVSKKWFGHAIIK